MYTEVSMEGGLSMKISLDYANNLGYFQFKDEPVSYSKNMSDAVVVDLNDQGQIIGIELLTLKNRLPLDILSEDMSIPANELNAIAHISAVIADSYIFGFSSDGEIEAKTIEFQ